mmetsp:Transcript_42824/g.118350  ORF Transcript_42824/g.118350 Transcript_42824/m.118350 type:complete len:233 (+) Transcript_42824:330-1028(+)
MTLTTPAKSTTMQTQPFSASQPNGSMHVESRPALASPTHASRRMNCPAHISPRARRIGMGRSCSSRIQRVSAECTSPKAYFWNRVGLPTFGSDILRAHRCNWEADRNRAATATGTEPVYASRHHGHRRHRRRPNLRHRCHEQPCPSWIHVPAWLAQVLCKGRRHHGLRGDAALRFGAAAGNAVSLTPRSQRYRRSNFAPSPRPRAPPMPRPRRPFAGPTRGPNGARPQSASQ